ncbi:MAG: ribonuclease [Actinomycetota bacterium]|nr:ribonuclease [Actinomycetota bacterium]
MIVSCDGASRGNPGPAGIGVQITDDDGSVLAEIAEGLGETTNNVAEYTAAIEGLKRALELGGRDVLLRSDSQLLINQLTGRYRVKTPHIVPLYEQVLALAGKLDHIEYEHVRRERNTEPDRLANEGVDKMLEARGR